MAKLWLMNLGSITLDPSNANFKFFLEDQTSAPAVSISCLFIPRTHFEAGLVMVDYYGYEI